MKNQPDLYSTVWVYNTIIFLIGVSNYFLKIMELDNIKDVKLNYDIMNVAFSLVLYIFYTYIFWRSKKKKKIFFFFLIYISITRLTELESAGQYLFGDFLNVIHVILIFWKLFVFMVIR